MKMTGTKGRVKNNRKGKNNKRQKTTSVILKNSQKSWNNTTIRQIIWSREFAICFKKSKKTQKLIDFNG